MPHDEGSSRIHFDSKPLNSTVRRTLCRQSYAFMPVQSQDKRPKHQRRLVFRSDDDKLSEVIMFALCKLSNRWLRKSYPRSHNAQRSFNRWSVPYSGATPERVGAPISGSVLQPLPIRRPAWRGRDAPCQGSGAEQPVCPYFTVICVSIHLDVRMWSAKRAYLAK